MKIFGFPCSGPQASVVTLGKLITTSHISMSANACSKVLILFLMSTKIKGGFLYCNHCYHYHCNNGRNVLWWLFITWSFSFLALAGPMNPGMALYSAHQIQLSSSPNQITYQEQGSCYSPGPHRSPVGTSKPFTMHPQTPEVWNAPITPTSSSFPYNPSRGGHRPSPGFGPRGSPRFNTRQGWGHWVSHSPSLGSRWGGSPSPGSGRGGSRWYGRSMSPVLGHSSGRGQGSHARLSGPQQFYNQSMLEDPWKFLKPVEWRRVL